MSEDPPPLTRFYRMDLLEHIYRASEEHWHAWASESGRGWYLAYDIVGGTPPPKGQGCPVVITFLGADTLPEEAPPQPIEVSVGFRRRLDGTRDDPPVGSHHWYLGSVLEARALHASILFQLFERWGTVTHIDEVVS